MTTEQILRYSNLLKSKRNIFIIRSQCKRKSGKYRIINEGIAEGIEQAIRFLELFHKEGQIEHGDGHSADEEDDQG